MKFHPHDGGALFVNGRFVLPGTFYHPPAGLSAEILIESAGEANASLLEAGDPNSLGGVTEGKVEVPAYDDITVDRMKSLLDLWGIDYSGQAKDKPTLYAFFVKEVERHNGNVE